MLKKLLLVDDDPDECHVFREILARIDPAIECYYAFNGKDALVKLTQRDIMVPDLFFVDIHMPVMNGWEFLAAIKKDAMYRKIPVIVYSTSSRNEDMEKAREHGAGYFQKPSEIEALHKKLQTLYQDSLASLLEQSVLK